MRFEQNNHFTGCFVSKRCFIATPRTLMYMGLSIRNCPGGVHGLSTTKLGVLQGVFGHSSRGVFEDSGSGLGRDGMRQMRHILRVLVLSHFRVFLEKISVKTVGS